LQAGNPAYRVEILGINLIGREAYNVAYTDGTSLPWLQDVPGQYVRANWIASDRDVYILDPMNQVFAVFNLYEHDLSLEYNRKALKALFLQAAGWLDTDDDTLCDHWERLHFQDLSPTPTGDPDGDGKDNFAEYSFGTDPLDANSRPSLQTVVVEQGGERFLEFSVNRRMGAQVLYSEETSATLSTWGEAGASVIMKEPMRNLFDGTGTGKATYRTATPIGGPVPWFFRMTALPGIPP
jgi:hypothetical protein